MEIRCLLDARAKLGEGPVWCDRRQALFWIDILAPAVQMYNPATQKRETIHLPSVIGAVALFCDERLLVALQTGLGILDLQSKEIQIRAHPELDLCENRYNDGKCDAKGRFWIGSMNMPECRPTGSLYRVEHDWRVRKALDGLIISNGMGWSPDQRLMYLADSGQGCIYVLDFDPEEGQVRNRRVFAPPLQGRGVADGLTVDTDGCVWCACWDGACVLRYDPSGRLDRAIEMPVPRPTSLTFGGSALKTLMVTSASCGLDPEWIQANAPYSGGLFAIEGTGAQGFPSVPFAGSL